MAPRTVEPEGEVAGGAGGDVEVDEPLSGSGRRSTIRTSLDPQMEVERGQGEGAGEIVPPGE
jgi:hypothetical protein